MSVGYCYLASFRYPQMKMMMAVSISRIFAFFLTFCVILKDGFGLPLSDQSEIPAQIPAQSVEPHHVRTKRCSCNNWLDKECIYFCHLDIIWVNTPSNILPYGLGSPLSRHRRSTDRCQCANPNDPTCSSFCLHRINDSKMGSLEENGSPSKTTSNKLLASLRSVVKSNMASVQQVVSSWKTHLTDSQLDKSNWR